MSILSSVLSNFNRTLSTFLFYMVELVICLLIKHFSGFFFNSKPKNCFGMIFLSQQVIISWCSLLHSSKTCFLAKTWNSDLEMKWREITPPDCGVNQWFVNKYIFKRFTSNSNMSNMISMYPILSQIKWIFKLVIIPFQWLTFKRKRNQRMSFILYK